MSTRGGSALAWWHVDVIGACVCAALTIGGYAIILQPIATERAKLAAMRADLAELRKEAVHAQATHESLENELDRVQTLIRDSAVQLESVEHLNARNARIVEIATRCGMQIDETQSGEIRTTEWYASIPIQVSGKGTYPSCAKFLHELQKQLPDVEVLAFELDGNPGRREAASSFRFDLAWYAAPAMVASE